jgi:RNA polymerase sigma-70 factor, ECF subfamily
MSDERLRSERVIGEFGDGHPLIRPTIGTRLGHAVALAQVEGPSAGLVALAQIEATQVASHQPYWAARVHLCAETGETAEALDAYGLAIGLSDNPAIRAFLQGIETRLKSLMLPEHPTGNP